MRWRFDLGPNELEIIWRKKGEQRFVTEDEWQKRERAINRELKRFGFK